ncbi:MOS1T transposase, partial [Pseudoatta argentina]
MYIFVPNKLYLRGILLHYFILKKCAAEAHRILVQTYGDNTLLDTTCRDWFRRFKNNDFELEDKERSGAPKKFQDKELEQLLDEDPSQTLSELGKILQVDESTVSKRLKGLGMIQKQGHWVPYELANSIHQHGNFTRLHPTRNRSAATTSYAAAQWETNYEITILSDFRFPAQWRNQTVEQIERCKHETAGDRSEAGRIHHLHPSKSAL